MERLDLTVKPHYSNQEAAIHLARYSNIASLVKDKVVLDIACGEGYGSALLMRAGAKKVVGIDISAEAIKKCKDIFQDSKVDYFHADACNLEDLFDPKTFDVIVSIETIEHVADDEAYLLCLKKIAKDNAVFFISCPNDNWYYKNPEDSNPFHLRKYTLADFQNVTKKILGDNVKWALGSATLGFGSVPLNKSEYANLDKSWLKRINNENGYFLAANDELDPVTEENCSYFMGMWNVTEFPYGAATFGVGMDSYVKMFEALSFDPVQELKSNLEGLTSQLNSIEIQLNDSKKELNNKVLLLMAADAENSAMRENINKLQLDNGCLRISNEEMQLGYWRYRRISEKIPTFVKKIIVQAAKLLKGARDA